MLSDLELIPALLAERRPKKLPVDKRTRAAVAMILRKGEQGLEVLLIQRALHELDPWSGHLAFPGGKVETGEDPRAAAERETLEEIGLDLSQACYLGPLGEITGRTLPVRVAGYVYLLNDGAGCQPVPNEEEVSALFWVSLSELMAPERQVTATVHFDGGTHLAPAINLQRANTPVLWGLTYRLVTDFIEICRLR